MIKEKKKRKQEPRRQTRDTGVIKRIMRDYCLQFYGYKFENTELNDFLTKYKLLKLPISVDVRLVIKNLSWKKAQRPDGFNL